MSPAIWRAPAAARRASGRDGADIVAFSELFIAGYPPEDLVLKLAFQAACRVAVETLARETGDGGPAALIGTPWLKMGNSTTLMRSSPVGASRRSATRSTCRITRVRREARVRIRAGAGPVSLRGVRLGLPIARNTWTDWGDYENVVETLAETGAGASARTQWLALLGRRQGRGAPQRRVARVTEAGLPLLYVNQVGGQMNSFSTARHLRSTSTARWRSSFRRSRKRW